MAEHVQKPIRSSGNKKVVIIIVGVAAVAIFAVLAYVSMS